MTRIDGGGRFSRFGGSGVRGKVLFAAALALLAGIAPARAADPLPLTNDFILRAPTAEVAGIASRNGLTIISQVATAVDEDGHGIYLVQADSGASAAQVIADIGEFEPAAAGIEQAVLASLPKVDQSTAMILDTSAVDSALGAIDGFDPPTATVSATWNDHLHDREIGPGRTDKLEFGFEHEAATDPAGYSLQVSFADGTTASSDQLTVSNHEVYFDLTNDSASDRLLATATLTWPAANGKLLTARLRGHSVLDAPYQKFGENPDGSDREVWTGYVNQPAVQALELESAQRVFQGEATVAIIDTGIDPTHPILAGNIVPGYDFVNDMAGSASEWADLDQSTAMILDQSTAMILDQSTAMILDQSTAMILDQSTAMILDTSDIPPAFGHGTMVAGVIHRTAPAARLMPLKAFDASGHAHLYDIVEAIYYAVDHGANVINASFSMETFSPALMRAVNYAARNGVVCVASAGNRGEEVLVFPASFGNTVGVASVSEADELSAFSNWGSDLVTISAPGENIVTTFPGGRFAVASGTSFSAPWVAGGVAIFADKLGTKHAPGRADYYLTSNALSTADELAGSGQGKSGYGRANLGKAVDQIKSGHYASDRPLGTYALNATFAEGCAASYPPPSSGGGCTVEGASQLKFENKKVLWNLTNTGEASVTLDSITITWEPDNGALRKIRLGGSRLDQTFVAPATYSIATGWLGGVEDRVIAPHQRLELLFEFDDKVIWTY